MRNQNNHFQTSALSSNPGSPRGKSGRAGEVPVADLAPVLQQILDALTEIRDTLAGTHKALLTIEEVGELTGRSSHTIRRWVK
jgi:hypothetical protein